MEWIHRPSANGKKVFVRDELTLSSTLIYKSIDVKYLMGTAQGPCPSQKRANQKEKEKEQENKLLFHLFYVDEHGLKLSAKAR